MVAPASVSSALNIGIVGQEHSHRYLLIFVNTVYGHSIMNKAKRKQISIIFHKLKTSAAIVEAFFLRIKFRGLMM